MCQLILWDNKKWYSFIGQLLSAVFCHIRAGVSSSLDTYVHVPQTVQFIFNIDAVSALLALNTIIIIDTKREKRSILDTFSGIWERAQETTPFVF